MFVAVRRYGVACTCQTNLISPFGHYAVSGLDSGQYLYAFAIVGTESYFLLLIAFFIQLQVYEEDTLLFRSGSAR